MLTIYFNLEKKIMTALKIDLIMVSLLQLIIHLIMIKNLCKCKQASIQM